MERSVDGARNESAAIVRTDSRTVEDDRVSVVRG